MTKTETRNDKLRAAHEKLQDAVAEIVSGDDWKRMLRVASKFDRYSFNNHLMERARSVSLALAATSPGRNAQVYVGSGNDRARFHRAGSRLRTSVFRSSPLTSGR